MDRKLIEDAISQAAESLPGEEVSCPVIPLG